MRSGLLYRVLEFYLHILYMQKLIDYTIYYDVASSSFKAWHTIDKESPIGNPYKRVLRMANLGISLLNESPDVQWLNENIHRDDLVISEKGIAMRSSVYRSFGEDLYQCQTLIKINKSKLVLNFHNDGISGKCISLNLNPASLDVNIKTLTYAEFKQIENDHPELRWVDAEGKDIYSNFNKVCQNFPDDASDIIAIRDIYLDKFALSDIFIPSKDYF